MQSVNHPLTILYVAVFGALAALFWTGPVWAGEGGALSTPAVTAPIPPDAALLAPVGRGAEDAVPVTVVELFSSQACVFCPEADDVFAELLQRDDIIGLACHVDYFDVREGSLARPFCTERQNRYMETLAAGPNYTPQMVIDGVEDVVGYKVPEVHAALDRAAAMDVRRLAIVRTSPPGSYGVALPPDLPEDRSRMTLWLAVYDAPHEVTVSEGRNKGKKAVYYHIVSALGATDRLEGPVVRVTPPLGPQHEGFAALLQDNATGRIYAAGEVRMRAGP